MGAKGTPRTAAEAAEVMASGLVRIGSMALLASVLVLAAGCSRGASFEHAEAEFSRGEFPEAAEEFAAIVERDERDLKAGRMLARALAASGENEQAVARYAQVVRASPDDHASLYEMALIERLLGRPGDAMRHLKAASELSPDEPSYLDELARTYMQLGHHADAAKAWGRAAGAEGLSRDARVGLLRLKAEAEVSGKAYPVARRTLRAALELAPENAEIRARLEGLDE